MDTLTSLAALALPLALATAWLLRRRRPRLRGYVPTITALRPLAPIRTEEN